MPVNRRMRLSGLYALALGISSSGGLAVTEAAKSHREPGAAPKVPTVEGPAHGQSGSISLTIRAVYPGSRQSAGDGDSDMAPAPGIFAGAPAGPRQMRSFTFLTTEHATLPPKIPAYAAPAPARLMLKRLRLVDSTAARSGLAAGTTVVAGPNGRIEVGPGTGDRATRLFHGIAPGRYDQVVITWQRQVQIGDRVADAATGHRRSGWVTIPVPRAGDDTSTGSTRLVDVVYPLGEPIGISAGGTTALSMIVDLNRMLRGANTPELTGATAADARVTVRPDFFAESVHVLKDRVGRVYGYDVVMTRCGGEKDRHQPCGSEDRSGAGWMIVVTDQEGRPRVVAVTPDEPGAWSPLSGNTYGDREFHAWNHQGGVDVRYSRAAGCARLIRNFPFDLEANAVGDRIRDLRLDRGAGDACGARAGDLIGFADFIRRF